MSTDIVFVAAKRTPFGAFGGSLASLSATDLAVAASQATLESVGINPREIDAVIFGNVVQSSSDAIYLARHVGLRIGVPEDRPALIVNRLCGSGFEAIAQGAYQILNEGVTTVLVGGTESMSQVPFLLRGARFGYRMGHNPVEDYLTASLTDSYTGFPMAITAENLAEKYSISRTACDEFALQSQKRGAAAWDQGLMKDEVAPVKVKSRKGEIEVTKDEHLRPDSTMEALTKLSPLFKKDGTVTAGNASGMVDGASALVMTTRTQAKAKGWPVLGTLVTWAATGCDPKIMGIGPVPATEAALKRFTKISGAARTVGDFDYVEINEAFAPQFLAVEKELGLKRDKTNIHGGAISLGHPLAASGARLVSHLLYQLKRESNSRYALASACIGGGQGMSVIIAK